MQLFSKAEIAAVLPQIDLLPAIEAGVVAYLAEKTIVPPVGELLLDKGEVSHQIRRDQADRLLRHQDRIRLLQQSPARPAQQQRRDAAV